LKQFGQLFAPGIPTVVCALVAAAVAGAVVFVLLHVRRQDPRLVLLALFAAAYVFFLVATITWFDRTTPLDVRLQAPLYVLIILAGVLVHRRAKAMIAVGAALFALNLLRAPLAARNPQPLDFFASRDILSPVAGISKSTPIYSNAPDLIYFRLGRPAVWLPTDSLLSRPFSPDKMPSDAAIVLIPDVRKTSATEDDLITAGFAQTITTKDGAIWKRRSAGGSPALTIY